MAYHLNYSDFPKMNALATLAQLRQCKRLCLDMAVAMKNGDDATKYKKMEELYYLTRQMENTTQTRILQLREDNYVQSMEELMCCWLMVEQKRNELIKKAPRQTFHFCTAEEANAWLSAQQNLLHAQLRVNYHTGGGFGMHTVEIDDIAVEVALSSEPTANRFGLVCETHRQLYAQTDVNDYAQRWDAANPMLERCTVQKCQSSGALAGNIGYIRFINAHFFILYRWKDPAVARVISEKMLAEKQAERKTLAG